jgi:hypothetical protein
LVIGLIIFCSALSAIRLGGVVGFIGALLLLPGVGALGMPCCAIYKILESVWILKRIRRRSNLFTESQVHLRQGIQSLTIGCLAFICTNLYFFWLFIIDGNRELIFYSVVCSIVPFGIIYCYVNEALQNFRAAGRFEEKERIESEKKETNYAGK